MDMQDKEMDELFGAKLYDLEVEPSAQVWSAIATELDAGKRKNLFLPILSIAASILVLVAAGILFIPKKVLVIQKPGGQSGIVRTTSTPKNTSNATVTNVPIITPQKSSAQINSGTNVATVSKHMHKSPPDIASKQNESSVAREAIPSQSVKADEQIALTVNPKRQIDIPIAVVPDADIPLVATPTMADRLAGTSSTQIANVQLPLAGQQTTPVTKQKHKIHNLGDLLNLAIAKVDKRQDKIIEFTDDDDDGSMITAVNLGILKTKKAK